MPFKVNAARRHHIPKQKRRVTNWAVYDASLRQRGSLTIWFSDARLPVGGESSGSGGTVSLVGTGR
jgi:hypothetical protein